MLPGGRWLPGIARPGPCMGCPIPVSSVSSVQFSQSVSWFGEASRGEPGYPDFGGTLKVKKADDWTCPFAPIKRSLHRSDAADCEVATPTPLIGWFSAPAGTFEFGHFQETHELPRFLHPPVAHVERVELAGQQVVAGGRGLCLVDYY